MIRRFILDVQVNGTPDDPALVGSEVAAILDAHRNWIKSEGGEPWVEFHTLQVVEPLISVIDDEGDDDGV